MLKPPQATRITVDKAESLAKKIAKTIHGGEVFALIGELGSGKTTFTKHLGKALGIKRTITSPTFVIMQEYPTPLKNKLKNPLFFYHLDLYRIQSDEDITALGLEHIWNNPATITVIEWADRITHLLPSQTNVIYFEPNDHQ